MKISYYLSATEVKRALFKTFSSQCVKWLGIIEANRREIEKYDGELKLAYHPANNTISFSCNVPDISKQLMAVQERNATHDQVQPRRHRSAASV